MVITGFPLLNSMVIWASFYSHIPIQHLTKFGEYLTRDFWDVIFLWALGGKFWKKLNSSFLVTLLKLVHWFWCSVIYNEKKIFIRRKKLFLFIPNRFEAVFKFSISGKTMIYVKILENVLWCWNKKKAKELKKGQCQIGLRHMLFLIFSHDIPV